MKLNCGNSVLPYYLANEDDGIKGSVSDTSSTLKNSEAACSGFGQAGNRGQRRSRSGEGVDGPWGQLLNAAGAESLIDPVYADCVPICKAVREPTIRDGNRPMLADERGPSAIDTR